MDAYIMYYGITALGYILFFMLLIPILMVPKFFIKLAIAAFRLRKTSNKVLIYDLTTNKLFVASLNGKIMEWKEGAMKRTMYIDTSKIQYLNGIPIIYIFGSESIVEKPEYYNEIQKLANAIKKEDLILFFNALRTIKKLTTKPKLKKKEEQTLEEANNVISTIENQIRGYMKDENIQIPADEFLSALKDGKFEFNIKTYTPIDYNKIKDSFWGINGYSISALTDALAEAKKNKMKLDSKELIILIIGACVGVGILYVLVSGHSSIDPNQIAQAVSQGIQNAHTTTATNNPNVIGP